MKLVDFAIALSVALIIVALARVAETSAPRPDITVRVSAPWVRYCFSGETQLGGPCNELPHEARL